MAETAREQLVLREVNGFVNRFIFGTVPSTTGKIGAFIGRSTARAHDYDIKMQGFVMVEYPPESDQAMNAHHLARHFLHMEGIFDRLELLESLYKKLDRRPWDDLLWLRAAGIMGNIRGHFDAMEKHIL